jgi:hypothetical protein
MAIFILSDLCLLLFSIYYRVVQEAQTNIYNTVQRSASTNIEQTDGAYIRPIMNNKIKSNQRRSGRRPKPLCPHLKVTL